MNTRITSRIATYLFFALTFLLPVLARAQAAKPTARQPLAVVAGTPIYEDELTPLMEASLRDLRNQEYELKSRALENLINQKLLEAAATKKGVPADKIVALEVDAKVADPTDAEVEAFYLGQNATADRPSAETKTKLREALKQARLRQARQDYMQSLWTGADVGVFLQPPKVEVGYDPSRLRGDPKAQVTIIEFSDFQCPYCRQSYPVMKQLLSKFPGQVKMAYRDFPLREIHPKAQLAAEAGRCANEQGKFWEYHDLLFSNPDKLDRGGLLEEAQSLKLDNKAFVSCLDTGKYRAAIDEDVKAGAMAKVEGTPAFFINGVLVSGFLSEAAFEQKINAELTRINRLQEVH